MSQNSAIENYDIEQAERMQVLPDTSIATDLPNTIPNDGTNACVFLALSICDTFLQKVKKVESVSWEELAKVAEKTITTLPGKINPFRNATERYDPLDAKAILTANNLLSANYELSGECNTSYGVFTESGRKQLINAFSKHASSKSKNHVGVYTCGKYTFLVGINGGSFFLVDTHPIGEELGGNGNGILVAAHDTGNRSYKLLVQWIMKRLLCSGVVPSDAQSFAWLMVFHKQGL